MISRSRTRGCRTVGRPSPRTTVRCLLACACALAACSTKVAVRSDEDPSADFAHYRSFGFFDPMGVEGGYNSPIFGELFREAITGEMTERGYRLDPEPDLLINVTLRTDDKVKMTAHTTPYMSGTYYHRLGAAYYGSAAGVGIGVGSRATKTTEISVFIDLVDAEKHQISWQGVAVTDASDKVAQRLRESIFAAVNRVYDLYPYSAKP